MATYGEFIAHQLDISEICRRIGADSLAYLSLEGMNRAVCEGLGNGAGHCNACFSGVYPVEIPPWLFSDDREKLVFEGMWGA